MGEPHVETFDGKYFYFGASAAHVAVVDVASYCSYHRGYSLKASDYVDIAHISGMPDFIAISKMCSVAVIPT